MLSDVYRNLSHISSLATYMSMLPEVYRNLTTYANCSPELHQELDFDDDWEDAKLLGFKMPKVQNSPLPFCSGQGRSFFSLGKPIV